MKFLAVTFFALSFFAQAEEIYVCPKLGAKLIKETEYTYQLKSTFSSLSCSIDYTTFPGTEVDMKILDCSKIKYYFTQLDENTVILSKNFVWSKDYSCQKQ